MSNFLKGSFIANMFTNITSWIEKKWSCSEIGWLFTRNLNDLKTKNSFIYKVLSAPLEWINSIALPEKMETLVNDSAILHILSKYEYGVYATVFLAPFIPTMACAGLVILTFISFFIYRLQNNDIKFKLDAVGFLIFSLVLIFGLFAITSFTPKSSIKIWLLYAPFIAFSYLLVSAVNTKERLKIVLSLFVTAGFLVSLYGLYQQFFGKVDSTAWLDPTMFTEITGRVYSTLENPNVLGEYLLLVIPICAGMIYASKAHLAKFYYFVVLCSSILCMVFTQSRGCWVGLILIAAIFAIFVDRRLLAFGILAAFVLPFVLPDSIITRFTSIGNINDSSTSYRVYIWLGTLNMLKDFGIYGIGLGSDAYNKIYPFYSYSSIIAPHAHNIYLQLLCETGIIGLGVFLSSMVISIKKIFLGYLSDKKGLCGIICATVIAGLLGFLLQGAFDYVWYNYRVFLIFWMTLAIGIAARRVQNDKIDAHN